MRPRGGCTPGGRSSKSGASRRRRAGPVPRRTWCARCRRRSGPMPPEPSGGYAAGGRQPRAVEVWRECWHLCSLKLRKCLRNDSMPSIPHRSRPRSARATAARRSSRSLLARRSPRSSSSSVVASSARTRSPPRSLSHALSQALAGERASSACQPRAGPCADQRQQGGASACRRGGPGCRCQQGGQEGRRSGRGRGPVLANAPAPNAAGVGRRPVARLPAPESAPTVRGGRAR